MYYQTACKLTQLAELPGLEVGRFFFGGPCDVHHMTIVFGLNEIEHTLVPTLYSTMLFIIGVSSHMQIIFLVQGCAHIEKMS